MYRKILNVLLMSNLFLSPAYANDYRVLIDKSERMAYIFEKEDIVKNFPIGIGKKGYETPSGEFEIINKVKNPSWTPKDCKWVSKKTKDHIQKNGGIPSGSKLNPLKNYWIGLSEKGIGIHDTPGDKGIGKRCSRGCVRSKTGDLEFIFEKLPLKTKVKIIE